MTTREQRELWRKLAEEATPGPWEANEEPGQAWICCADGSEIDLDQQWPRSVEQTRNNAAFIAAAREAVPALLEEVERLSQHDEDRKAVMREECAQDEKHCTCVPLLRAEVERLTELVRSAYNEGTVDGATYMATQGRVPQFEHSEARAALRAEVERLERERDAARAEVERLRAKADELASRHTAAHNEATKLRDRVALHVKDKRDWLRMLGAFANLAADLANQRLCDSDLRENIEALRNDVAALRAEETSE